MSFVKLKVGAGHPFAGRSLADIGSATDMLVVLVLRDGAHPVLPNGDTVIQEGDLLVMAAPTFEERAEVTLREVTVTPPTVAWPASACAMCRKASIRLLW